MGDHSRTSGGRGEIRRRLSPAEETAADAGTVPITPNVVPFGRFSLGVRERATAAEFAQIDLQLAGLYQLGHELTHATSEAGVGYVLAHLGRELSRGVVQQLADDELQTVGPDEDPPETDRNRMTIGAVLGLPAEHPLVTVWFRLNATFSRSCHYRFPAPALDEIRSAFLQFSELLFGRVAPYFATHAELEGLLAIATPSADDLERAGSLLLRSQQRRHFFSRLRHVNWLALLAEREYFNFPPERAVEPDGSWRVQPWPEGEYLVRMAGQEPSHVTELLLHVPPTLQNPAVWNIMVAAANSMPGVYAARIVPLLIQGLKNAPPVLFPHRAIELVANLAAQGEKSAFPLAGALLWLSGARDPGDCPQNSTRFSGGRATAWVLQRLEPFELGQFCSKTVPTLEALEPFETIQLLATRLDRAVFLLARAAGNERKHDSHRWCEDLDRRCDSDDDVRAMLAVALTPIVQRTAARGREFAAAVWAAMRPFQGDIFERIRYAVLVEVGPHLQAEIDRLVGSDALLDPPFGAREAAALLRARFGDASHSARLLFRYALERGPSTDEVQRHVELRRSLEQETGGDAPENRVPPTAEEIAQVVSVWQRKRLRWFHDRIPDELRPLADRLGLGPEVPSLEQQALDEVGYHSSGVVYIAERSPKSIDELSAMEPQAITAFLDTWRADARSFDAPSYRGLREVLTGFAEAHPARAVQVTRDVLSKTFTPGYVSALLSGLCAAVKVQKEIPWPEVLAAALGAVRAADREGVIWPAAATVPHIEEAYGAASGSPRAQISPPDLNAWRLVISAAADLLRESCAINAVPSEFVGSVWEIAEAAVRSSIPWMDRDGRIETPSFDHVMMAALNTAAGDVRCMLLEVALWNYRLAAAGASAAQPRSDISDIEAHVIPLIEHVLSQRGRKAESAHAMLGQFVPQLYLLAPTWTPVSEEKLFGGGAENPISCPVWGAYVTKCPLYDATFRQLRLWYVKAAEAAAGHNASTDPKGRDDRWWAPTSGLATHVLEAVTRGLAAVGDGDGLVEKTFRGVPVRHRSHAYWSVFRTWSDARTVPEDFGRRLGAFWEWRLSELERADDTTDRSEEVDGLMWFLMSPGISPAEAIRLGRRTMMLGEGSERTHGSGWDRLGQLAEADAIGTFELAELLVERELAADHPYLPYENVAAPLQAALACGDITISQRAARLIHRMGERGYLEFGKLLP